MSDWLAQVKEKVRNKNQILFSQQSTVLQNVIGQMEGMERRALILWAFECAEQAVRLLEERYPHEARPRTALEKARQWAAGQVKMMQAKRAILDCHALAGEIYSPEDAALCHAVGQACSVVHTAGHAIGFPIYELTAIVRRYGAEYCKEPVEARTRQYMERLAFWQAHAQEYHGAWAAFLQEDSQPLFHLGIIHFLMEYGTYDAAANHGFLRSFLRCAARIPLH